VRILRVLRVDRRQLRGGDPLDFLYSVAVFQLLCTVKRCHERMIGDVVLHGSKGLVSAGHELVIQITQGLLVVGCRVGIGSSSSPPYPAPGRPPSDAGGHGVREEAQRHTAARYGGLGRRAVASRPPHLTARG
jgi:hypothetical protein